MDGSEISTETFNAAHGEAIEASRGILQAINIAPKLAEILVGKLTEEGRINAEEAERLRERVHTILDDTLLEKGLEFVVSQRAALRIALLHGLAERMSILDMSAEFEAVKRPTGQSGQFSLNLPSSPAPSSPASAPASSPAASSALPIDPYLSTPPSSKR